MTTIAALVVWLTVKATFAEECPNPITCPCGNKGGNVTVCVPPVAGHAEVCTRFSKCEACEDGLRFCTKCPEGLEGPTCSREIRKSRQKRQSTGVTPNQRNPETQSTANSCSPPKSPQFGRRRCVPRKQQILCSGKCFPGHYFGSTGKDDEMTLTCSEGVWTPRSSFPDCKSAGLCDLVNLRTGSSNCTTGMDGTRCIVYCNNNYMGRFSCYPGHSWTPTLPPCVQPKADFNDGLYCNRVEPVQNGRVQYFAPGFGGNSTTGEILDHQTDAFPVATIAVFTCDEGFQIRGHTTLVCERYGEGGGVWSLAEPDCVQITCKNPGHVANSQVVYILPANEGGSPGQTRGEYYTVGSILQYTCEDGYDREGPRTLTCESTGSWSPAIPPACLKTDLNDLFGCENPGRVLNGRMWYYPPGVKQRNGTGMRLDVEMDEYPAGSVLEYTCDKGFRLTGSHSLKCEESTGFWSAERPRCDGDCGQSFVKTTVRIRDGQQTVIGEWPWVVSISLQEEDSSRFVCGGAVFNTRSVVTAAHCLEAGRTYILRFGKHHFRIEDDDSNVLVRTSNRVIIHPDYSRRTLDSDIGLILFQQTIEYSERVQPICLPTFETTFRNIRTGKVGYVSGWGDTELELSPNNLLFAGLPVLSIQDCEESYRKQNLSVSITGNMFCAGFRNGTYSVCGGDSGSPFVFYDSLSGRYTMEGLVSFVVRRRTDAQECGLPGRFAIFTKVFRFVPWMYQNIE